MNRLYLIPALGLAAFLLGAPTHAHAQAAPPLGTAAPFSVLAGSAVTNTGTSVVTGDVGVSPGSAITGFPPGVVIGGTLHSNDAVAVLAQSDLTIAYNNVAAAPCTLDLTGQDLGGMILTPGVYCFSSSAQLTGLLRLNAQGDPAAVFLFKIGSSLTTASGATVQVFNGGVNCNVFWQVGSSATLGTATTFAGNILALTSITLTTGATISGRALARNGAVTLDTNTINRTACVAAPVCPAITVNPPVLPNATVGTLYNQLMTGSGGTAPYVFTVNSGTLPAGLTLNPAGPLSGIPTTAGPATFVIRGTDAIGCFADATYTLTVLPAPVCPVITLSPATLTHGTVGTPYSQQITASGGTAPYVFSVQSGTLPAGLTLNPVTGFLTGTPTTAATSSFVVRGTDANGCFADIPYTLTILAPVPTLPQWGIIALALMLGTAAFMSLRRRV